MTRDHGLQDFPGRHTARRLQSLGDRLDNALAKLRAQEPVIKAAKACADDVEYLTKQAEKIGAEYPRNRAFLSALRALQEVEGG